MSEEQKLIGKKKAVLKRLYGGKRKPYMHDFRIEDGVCRNCGVFLGDKNETLLCRIITRDETRSFSTV